MSTWARAAFPFTLAATMVFAGLSLLTPSIAQDAQPRQACLVDHSVNQPTKATFANGNVLTVVERGDDLLRHELLTPNGARIKALTYRGLFTLAMEQPAVKIEMKWKEDLAQFVPLSVGKRIVAEASYLSPSGFPDYVTEMDVVGIESIAIGSCEYPVFKIEVVGGQKGGALQAKSTRYYHEPSRLTLRTVTITPETSARPSRAVEERVVTLE